MDVSSLIQAEASKYKSITVDKDIPAEIDVGFLTVTDLNPIDSEAYNADREAYLQETARDGIQLLFNPLFSLPTQSSEDGPLALLPTSTTILPRAKPLPKPKPPTKWETFAAAKGIQKKVKEKKVWNEEKGEWVNSWGQHGKNKELEEQWIHELPDNAADDFDPVKEARTARKARVSQNEQRQLKNLAHSKAKSTDERSQKKADLDRSLATTRVSTASMGKFDKKLEGEPKLRGVKRKFEPAEKSLDSEKKTSLAILSKLDGTKRPRKESSGGPPAGDDVLNVRKAVRFASKGRGGLALGREMRGRETAGRGGRGRGRGGGRGGKRGRGSR